MAVFWLSFRIADETAGGETYDERIDSLYSRIKDISEEIWVDTTSFILFETDYKLDELSDFIKEIVSERIDIVLIGSMKTNGGRIIGETDDLDTLRSLFPKIKST